MLASKYRIGDIVCHIKQGYIGVIIDADPAFLPRGVRMGGADRLGADEEMPWYRVLVDDTAYTSYVKESLLKEIPLSHPIIHPELNEHLTRVDGRYLSQRLTN